MRGLKEVVVFIIRNLLHEVGRNYLRKIFSRLTVYCSPFTGLWIPINGFVVEIDSIVEIS